MSAVILRSRTIAPVILAIAFSTSLLSSPASATAPHCHPYGTGAYCQYDGKVRIAYINAYNQIILYFDTPMSATEASSVGISGVSIYDSAVYPISENPDFAKALYASLLAAQARGAMIQVQTNGTSNGYLRMDRIWVHEN